MKINSLKFVVLQVGPIYQEVCYSYVRVHHSTLKTVKVKLKWKDGLGRNCLQLIARKN